MRFTDQLRRVDAVPMECPMRGRGSIPKQVLIKNSLSIIRIDIGASGARDTVTLWCDDPPLTKTAPHSYLFV